MGAHAARVMNRYHTHAGLTNNVRPVRAPGRRYALPMRILGVVAGLVLVACGEATEAPPGPKPLGDSGLSSAEAGDGEASDSGVASDVSCYQTSAYYLDADGDGFGAGPQVFACSAPPGYVANHDDCADNDARAFPGQAGYFTYAIASTKSYDFGCTGGTPERRWPNAGSCNYVDSPTGPVCLNSGAGTTWKGPVPSCGEVGQWLTECSPTCVAKTEPRSQECRSGPP